MSTNNSSSFFQDLLQDPATLDRLAVAYGKPEVPLAPIVTSSVSVQGNTALISPAQRKAIKSASKKASSGAPSTLPSLPETGSVDATQFLALLRNAGMRPSAANPKVMVRDELAARQDQRSAVGAFVGFNWQEPLGTQLDRATLKARHQIAKSAQKPEKQAETFEHRSPMAHVIKWSVSGFVAGLPNAIGKMLADLAGRERLAVDEVTMFSNLRDSVVQGDKDLFFKLISKLEKSNPSLVDNLRQQKDVRLMLAQLHALAETRLLAIREDIAGLDSENPTPEQIERAHAAMLRRGCKTYHEEMTLIGETPKI